MICIKNCTLLSMEEDREKVEYNMDILIDGTKIIQIGKNIFGNINKENINIGDTNNKEAKSKDLENIEIIDATGRIVMPGLINTHAHVPMSIFRETLDGYNLQDWLSKKIWPMEDKLTKEDIYYASYLSFIEMIKTGTTTINDMYFMTEEIIRAMIESGIRLQTTRTLMDLTGEEESENRIKELEELIKNYNGKYERLTFNVGIHGLYTSSNKYLDRCLEIAKKYSLPVHMHFCENSEEVENIKQKHQATPVEVLKIKFNNTKTILAHSVKLSEEDIDKIKNMNISVSHCPISNLKLGCGIAKINYMLENNINVSLGTDGQGSGSNLDLFEAMKYTALLQKGITEKPEKMPAYDVIKMATINGAKALGLEKSIGSIKEGKSADIIIIDVDNVTIKPVNNLISEIVYNVKGNNVMTTIVNGKILMKDRILLQDKTDEIYRKCDEIIKRISV